MSLFSSGRRRGLTARGSALPVPGVRRNRRGGGAEGGGGGKGRGHLCFQLEAHADFVSAGVEVLPVDEGREGHLHTWKQSRGGNVRLHPDDVTLQRVEVNPPVT